MSLQAFQFVARLVVGGLPLSPVPFGGGPGQPVAAGGFVSLQRARFSGERRLGWCRWVLSGGAGDGPVELGAALVDGVEGCAEGVADQAHGLVGVVVECVGERRQAGVVEGLVLVAVAVPASADVGEPDTQAATLREGGRLREGAGNVQCSDGGQPVVPAINVRLRDGRQLEFALRSETSVRGYRDSAPGSDP